MVIRQKLLGRELFTIAVLVLILVFYFIITELLPHMSVSDGTNECVGCAVFGPVSLFVGNALDAREMECRNYWKNSSPFAITDYKCEGNLLTLTLTNKRDEVLVLTHIYIDGLPADVDKMQFSPGQTKKVVVPLIKGCVKSGDIFDFNVEFTYDNSHVSGMQQMGARAVFGRCS